MSRSPAHVALVALVAVAVACGPATDTPPELGTVPRVAASPAPEATPEATPDEVESRARGNGIRVADGAAREALNKHRERLSEERELAIKYADGALGDALTTKRLLLVDAAAPADTREVRYYLLRGDVPTPASFDALKDARGEDGGRASSFVLGGEDAARPGLFRDVFRKGRGGRKWAFNQSGLFLDFLAGNQTYQCTPWGNPTRNVFGWQKPCYLLNEGTVSTFKELMEGTDWDAYGVGKYAKCSDCMVHCGFEATAVADSVHKPWKAAKVALAGVRTEGAFAPDIPIDRARPAEYVFSANVQKTLTQMREEEAREAAAKATAAE